MLVQGANSVVYATTSDSVLESSDFGSTWQTAALVANSTIEAAAFVDAGQTIYLGLMKGQGSSLDAILLRSTDGGGNFTTLMTVPSGATFNTIAVSPTNPNVLWVSIFENYQSTEGLYYSTDGGTSWTPFALIGPQYVAIDPQDPYVVYAGNDWGLYKSVDGGPLQAFPLSFDIRDITFGETNDTILVGADQGLFVTHDGGTTWDGLNHRANNLITSVAATDSRIIFEAQDYTMPVVSCDNGTSWTTGSGGCTTFYGQTQESGYVVADPYNDSWVMIYAQPVAEPDKTSALVSHDGGVTFASMRGLPNETGYSTWSYGYSASLIAFAPTAETAYFAGGAVYKTLNGGSNWSLLASSPANASGVAVSFQDSSLVYAVNSTGLFVSRDAGESWSLAHPDRFGALSKAYFPESVAVDQENGSVVMVGNPYCGCLERSTNGGVNMANQTWGFLSWPSTWHLGSYLLSSGRVALVILTGSSLYVSFDFGTTWARFAQGLPGNSLMSFHLSAQGDGFVATYGFGLWEWRSLSAAFDAAPVRGPIPGPPPFSAWTVVFAVLGVAGVAGVCAALAFWRRRSGKRKG